MPQYTYGSDQNSGPSTTELARRITELQNEVTLLKAERTQWRATLKQAVTAEVEEAVASTSSTAPAAPSASTQSDTWRRSIDLKSSGDGSRAVDLQKLEERLAKRVGTIAQRIGNLSEQQHQLQASPASSRGHGLPGFGGRRSGGGPDAMLMSESNVGGQRMPRISPMAGGVIGGNGPVEGGMGDSAAAEPDDENRRQSTAVHLLRQFHGHQSNVRQQHHVSHLNSSAAVGGLNFSTIPLDDDDRKPSLSARLVRRQQPGGAFSPKTGNDASESDRGNGPSPRAKPPLGAHGSMRGIAQATRAAIAMGGSGHGRPTAVEAAAVPPADAAALTSESSALKQQPSVDLDRMRRDLAKASTTKARTDGSRGLSERHPFIAVLDVLFVITSTVVCMLAISITHAEGRKTDFAEESPGFTTAVVAIIAIEVFTCGWMASRLFVSLRKGDWEIIDDLPGIRGHYLRTWFGFDLLYSIPVELVFVSWQWDALRWFALRHFLRVPRMIKLGGSFNPLLSSRLWFRFLSVVLLLVLGVSILAAIFWGLEPRYSFEESLYWAIATVTSVGYGDVVPDDQTSRIFVCFAMFAGIVAISIITAFATSFLTESDKLKAEEDTRKQMMYAMLEHYNVPWAVQKEVIGAMPTMLEDFNKASFTEMTAHLPTFVGQKVTDYVQAKVLMQQAVFKRVADAEPQHLLTLSRFVHQDVYAPDTVIAEEGSPADTLFFIVRGQVRLLMISFDDPDDEDGDGDCEAELVDMGTLRAGETFGEFDVEESGQGPSPRSMSAVSETVVNVLILNRDSLNELQAADPRAHAALLQSLATNATTEETTFENFVRL